MGVVSGRARMSSRGQIVIPKVLREAAGMAAGDEVEVSLDGQRLILCPCRRDGDLSNPAARESLGGQGRLSKVWADRVRALAGIERLRAEFAGLRFEDLWRESRRELEGGEPGD